MYQTLERAENAFLFKLEKRGSRQFSPKILTYLSRFNKLHCPDLRKNKEGP